MSDQPDRMTAAGLAVIALTAAVTAVLFTILSDYPGRASVPWYCQFLAGLAGVCGALALIAATRER